MSRDTGRVTSRFCTMVRPKVEIGISVLCLASASVACTPFYDDPSRLTDGAVEAFDAGQKDGRLSAACDSAQPFGAPRFVEGLSDPTSRLVGGLRLSPDGLTAYYDANPVDGALSSAASFDLFVGERASTSSVFVLVPGTMGPGINTSADETSPTVSGDGLLLIFQRAFTGQPAHLFYATRASTRAPFAYGGPLPAVNDPSSSDARPFLRQDGQALYFDSNRGGAGSRAVYRAAWTGTSFGAPVLVDLAGLSNPWSPVVSSDELTLYVVTVLPAPQPAGATQVWRMSRASVESPFSSAVLLTSIGGVLGSVPTFVSPDDCALYFSSYQAAPNADGTGAQYLVERGGGVQ